MKITEDFLRRLERLTLVAKKMFGDAPTGQHPSHRRGPSIEFRDHRAYAPGDELRYVDWNAYARLDQPYVKEFEAEEAVHVGVVLDASESMNFADKFEAARTIAAALSYIALANLDSLTLYRLGERLDVVRSTLRGRHTVIDLLEQIEAMSTGGRTDFRAALRDPLTRLRGRSILFVVTDFYDREGYPDAIRSLRAQKFDVNLIHVVAAEEKEPKLEGRYVLVDLETGARRKLAVTSEMLARYREAWGRFAGAVDAFALQHEIACVRLDAESPLEEMIGAILKSSGMLAKRK